MSKSVCERNDKALFGEERRCDFGARVDNCRIDQETILHAIEQRIAEGWMAILATECAISVEQQAPLGLTRVARAWVGIVELSQVIARRCGEPKFVANEVVKHCARIATD